MSLELVSQVFLELDDLSSPVDPRLVDPPLLKLNRLYFGLVSLRSHSKILWDIEYRTKEPDGF